MSSSASEEFVEYFEILLQILILASPFLLRLLRGRKDEPALRGRPGQTPDQTPGGLAHQPRQRRVVAQQSEGSLRRARPHIAVSTIYKYVDPPPFMRPPPGRGETVAARVQVAGSEPVALASALPSEAAPQPGAASGAPKKAAWGVRALGKSLLAGEPAWVLVRDAVVLGECFRSSVTQAAGGRRRL